MKTRQSINAAAAVLWASAFLLAAMVITQAGRLIDNPAYANQAVESNGYTLLTVNSGRGEDCDPYELLYVIDSREQTLLVYEIEDAQRRQITLRNGMNLPSLFRNARPR